MHINKKLELYLNEIIRGQYAPLYHSTSYVNFLSIIKDEKIKPNKLGYIFLSRDRRYRVRGSETPIVFIIDQEKIRQKLKIKPRVGDISNKNRRIEAEEVVKGHIPLDWVQEILVPGNLIRDIENAKEKSIKGIEWALEQIKISDKNRIVRLQKGIKTHKKDIELYNKILLYPKISKI